MAYTLGEAARASGKSKAAIAQAIASSRLSATKDDLGRWQIDPADLHRVYPSKHAQANDSAPPAETMFLREKVTLLEELVAQLKGERDRLLLLLPKPTEQPAPAAAQNAQQADVITAAPKRRGWFGWRRTG
jgi:hypothetical protein